MRYGTAGSGLCADADADGVEFDFSPHARIRGMLRSPLGFKRIKDG